MTFQIVTEPIDQELLIPLRQRLGVIGWSRISRCDAGLAELRWYQLSNGYVVRTERDSNTGHKTMLYLHRAILDAPTDAVVDHINGDKLDNRRCNLRLASRRGTLRSRRCPEMRKGQRFQITPEVRAEIIELAARGVTNAELAEHFGVTERTLCRHRARDARLNEGIKAARRDRAELDRRGHGTQARYRAGCRCEPCTRANTDKCARYRAGKTAAAATRLTSMRDQIESRIARGSSTSSIMAELDVDYATVRLVRDGLDLAAAS